MFDFFNFPHISIILSDSPQYIISTYMFHQMIKTNFVCVIYHFKFSEKCLSFRWESVDEFPKIVPYIFGPFIGHHQRLLACKVCLYFFFKFWKFIRQRMMAYEGSESARDNFVKFIDQFQPETKTLIKKLERVLNKLYRQNLSWLFNETNLNERLLSNHTHTHTHVYIYIYIYIYIKLGERRQSHRSLVTVIFSLCDRQTKRFSLS